jgi:hypothetical protein
MSNRGLIEHYGGVYRERQAEHFRSIDWFVFPSRTELWGSCSTSQLAEQTYSPIQN